MSKITSEEIKHIAKLANLKIGDKEVNKFQKQLSSVLDYVSELEKVDTAKIEPTNQTTGLQNVFRVDKVRKECSLNVKDALSGTEETYNDYFKISAIFDEK
jgi:aspartyl-tRNA(Asn)/glutamyl-tRNA(Gln) amidotransferase subunit C